MLFSGLSKYCTHMINRCTCKQNTDTNKIKTNLYFKKEETAPGNVEFNSSCYFHAMGSEANLWGLNLQHPEQEQQEQAVQSSAQGMWSLLRHTSVITIPGLLWQAAPCCIKSKAVLPCGGGRAAVTIQPQLPQTRHEPSGTWCLNVTNPDKLPSGLRKIFSGFKWQLHR